MMMVFFQKWSRFNLTNKIKVPFELINDLIDEGYDFSLEDEYYILHESDYDEGMDDDGCWKSHIYKRESDGKFFIIYVNRIRYGYENYALESWVNDDVELKEVKKITITNEIWKEV